MFAMGLFKCAPAGMAINRAGLLMPPGLLFSIGSCKLHEVAHTLVEGKYATSKRSVPGAASILRIESIPERSTIVVAAISIVVQTNLLVVDFHWSNLRSGAGFDMDEFLKPLY